MFILFFIFIIMPLVVLVAFAVGLLALFTHSAISAQVRRLGKFQGL